MQSFYLQCNCLFTRNEVVISYLYRTPCRGMQCNENNIDGLVQERRNSIANALELRISCTNPSIMLPGWLKICAQPMRDGVTLQQRLSLAGCKSRISPMFAAEFSLDHFIFSSSPQGPILCGWCQWASVVRAAQTRPSTASCSTNARPLSHSQMSLSPTGSR